MLKALNVPQKKDLYPDPILCKNLDWDPDHTLSVEKGSRSRSYPRSDPPTVNANHDRFLNITILVEIKSAYVVLFEINEL